METVMSSPPDQFAAQSTTQFPARFALYPAIDLRRGKVVRLTQGQDDATTIYDLDPVTVARSYVDAGAECLHLVDLDAAFGDGDNRQVIRAVVRELGVPVQVGGGVRSDEAARELLDAGVTRVIVGSRAAEDPEWVRGLVARFGEQVVAGIDARDGQVMLRGWVEGAGRSAVDVARDMAAAGVKTVIYTNIANDGMLSGPDFDGSASLGHASGLGVIVSGGVGSLADVVHAAGATPSFTGLIIGKALFEGRFTMAQAMEASRA
jgi:phosphoribosylformimino-5-aminoimidazole carboxamide ribotide isomerase